MKEVKRIFEKLINNDVLLVMVFSLIFYSIVISRNGIVYSMNDDITLRGIVSGIYLGTPSINMIFSAFPFSALLYILYKITDIIDWYGLILILSNMFFLSYTIYNIIKTKKETFEKIVYIAFIFYILSVLFYGFLVQITFTTSATFIATCCLILYLLPNESKFKNVVIIAGIALAYGIRPKACIMELAFFIPAILYKNIKNREKFKKDFLLGVKIFIVLLACLLADKISVRDLSWKEYLIYNNYRSLYYDYYFDQIKELPKEEKKEMFYEAGFSDGEMNALSSWTSGMGFYDSIPSKMPLLIEQCEAHGLKINPDVKGTIEKLLKKDLNKYYIITIFIMCYVILKSPDKKTKFVTVLSFVFLQIAFLLYLVIQGRIPDRVIVPLYFSYIVMNLFITLNEDEIKNIAKKVLYYDKKFIMICAIVLFIVATQNVNIYTSKVEGLTEKNKILKYFEKHPENFYIYDRNSKEEYSLINKYTAKNYINKNGWTTFSPLYTEKINNQGAGSLKDLLFKDNVYLVLESANANNYKTIDENVKIEKIDQVNNYYIYKFTKQ